MPWMFFYCSHRDKGRGDKGAWATFTVNTLRLVHCTVHTLSTVQTIVVCQGGIKRTRQIRKSLLTFLKGDSCETIWWWMGVGEGEGQVTTLASVFLNFSMLFDYQCEIYTNLFIFVRQTIVGFRKRCAATQIYSFRVILKMIICS